MKFSNVYSLRLNFRSILRRSEPLQMQARGYARQSFNGGQQRLKSHMTVKAIAVSSLGLTGLGAGYVFSESQQLQNSTSTTTIENAKTIHHNVSPSNIRDACAEFAEIVDENQISNLNEILIQHSGSDYLSHPWDDKTAELGHVVIYPQTTEEVSEIAKICHRRRIPITPYSGGTSIEGQYMPTRGGVCVDFSRMNKILKVNPTDLDCTVQPGLEWMDLNSELASENLFFPPDPGPGAMIGGMVGTGCSGTNAAAYGTMKDWVLSLTVVLADGTIIKTRQRARKSSAGYDLTRTFVGSEGTLGMVTETTLKLAVKPQCEVVAVCTFPDVRSAAKAVQAVMSRGIPVAAVEILDDVQMQSINKAGLTKRKWDEHPSLFFKFAGSSDAGVLATSKLVQGIAQTHGSKSFMVAASAEEREELWSARKAALWSMMSLRKSATDKVWTTDVAVPLSRLPDIIEQTKDDIKESGLLGSIVGHVGDGNFHALLLFAEDKRHIAEHLVHKMVERAIAMDGTATGEHGIGLVKRDYLEAELGKNTVDAMRKMKLAFDPLCILNCDKVIRMEAATPI
ncbi:D-lactate ferricytochrome c oxidoreductase [Pseudogymnoascus australis]